MPALASAVTQHRQRHTIAARAKNSLLRAAARTGLGAGSARAERVRYGGSDGSGRDGAAGVCGTSWEYSSRPTGPVLPAAGRRWQPFGALRADRCQHSTRRAGTRAAPVEEQQERQVVTGPAAALPVPLGRTRGGQMNR